MKKSPAAKSVAKAKDLRFTIVATDVVLWTITDSRLLVRLIPVNIPGFIKDKNGLPGGLVKPEENTDQSVKRILAAKAKISTSKVYLEQLYTFSGINRDPRGRVVAVAYTGIVPWDQLTSSERESAPGEVWWNDAAKLPAMAYDHKEIISQAIVRLRTRVAYTNIIAHFLPKEFTLTDLQEAYELILGKALDKRNFRKKILLLGILKALSKERRGGKFRPAKLYSFKTLETKDIEIL